MMFVGLGIGSYTATGVTVLDRFYRQLSEPATKRLTERASKVFGDPAYARLVTIAHLPLYRLRASGGHGASAGAISRFARVECDR